MREPDFRGEIAEGWKVKLDRSQFDRVEQEGTLGSFLVHGPFHPAWHWWAIPIIHLRPIPGGKPPSKNYPEAEYEICIVSLDPDHPITDVDDYQQLAPLSPTDLTFQFDLKENDDAAIQVCEALVKSITEGKTSPDFDYRGQNIAFLTEAVGLLKETL